ncbi:MAG: V-type ATP synthase subunit E [Candidatus Latescibacteria bacterium]|nr:V-type ATP synthase subunit E [Candidatus Latescibacterota bacterium]
MPVKAITDKIIGDAQAEANKIIRQAEAEIAEIKKDAQDEIDLIEAEATKQAILQAEEEKERLISTAEMGLKQEFLREKQTLLDETFQRARDKVLTMRPEQYKELMGGLLIAAAESGDAEVIVAESDKDRITAELLEKVNQKLQAGGKKGKLRLSAENRNIPGGFVLRKGRKEINCSLQTIFATARMELESEVAAILFAEERGKNLQNKGRL